MGKIVERIYTPSLKTFSFWRPPSPYSRILDFVCEIVMNIVLGAVDVAASHGHLISHEPSTP